MSNQETVKGNLIPSDKGPIEEMNNKRSQKESNALLCKHDAPVPGSSTQNTERPIEISCRTCNSADDSRMVQCDKCDGWYHFSCVGVSQEIQHHDWICADCLSVKASQRKTLGAKRKPPLKSKSNKPKQTGLSSKKQEVAVSEMSQKVLGHRQVEESSSKNGSVISGSSKRSTKALLAVQLQKIEAEETLMKEEIKRKRELMEKRFSLLEEMAEIEAETSSASMQHTSSSVKVKNWLNDRPVGTLTENGKCNDGDHCDFDNDDSATSSDDISGDNNVHDSSNEIGDKQRKADFNPPKRSTPVNTRMPQTSRTTICTNCPQKSLTSEQIAARQVVPRDLPKFNGNPDDWPMFLSTYESTTSICGYKNEENMIRLRNCLKDDALTAVRSFLMHPSTVPKAIAALKLRFGQPQTIINSLKEKILAMPSVKSDSLDRLIDFALAVQNLCATIDACGRKEYSRDVTLLHDLINKLTPSLKLDWARHQKTLRKINLVAFNEWLYALAEDATVVADPRGNRKGKVFLNAHLEEHTATEEKTYVSKQMYQPMTPTVSYASSGCISPGNVAQQVTNTDVMKSCRVCKSDCKSIGVCKIFVALTYEARWATVRGLRLCGRCLKQHRGGCNGKICGKNGCTFKHHPLLHKDLTIPQEIKTQTSRESEHDLHMHQTPGAGMFRYVPVKLYGAHKHIQCYAFLDDGSALTLMDQQIADDLELPGENSPLCLRWTGGTHRYEDNSQIVSVDISGYEGKKFHLNGVRTVEELQLPYQSLDMDDLQERHPYLEGLPINSYHNVRPRILIGLKHANITLVRRSREGTQGEPIAVKTALGWTVFGVWPQEPAASMVHYTCHICSCDDNLQQIVKEYFSIDSLGIEKSNRTFCSTEDERALSLLESRTRCMGKHFETGLLWRYDEIQLPDSRPMALKRLNCLRGRMAKDPQLACSLNLKIAEYQSKGYIRKLSQDEVESSQQRVWYLPIFPVINPNKPGKLRIVWDAAAPVRGISLNSVLLTGPDQLTSLISVLQRFREHRFGISGDLREMFHQVRIRKEDQNCQRFLWYDGKETLPSTFVMQVMTFGACCSPSTAQFIKNKNAERFEADFPQATTAILKNHYVDDWLASVETEAQAINLAKSVRHVHAEGGFEMCNWVSNSSRVLSELSEKPTGSKDLNLGAALATERVLGMWWDTSSDSFTFKICWERLDPDLRDGCRRPTKRDVLRVLMVIFDPLGLIAHYLMFLKIVLQEIWRSGVQWDEPIPDKQYSDWKCWIELLPSLEDVRVRRCYRDETSASNNNIVQLHTFVDASENGMAAVVFLRFEEEGTIECALVGAKTRVSPLKYMSIPRLELQAAVIGTRLANTIMESLTVKISERFYWTDSRNVLCWLNSDHRRYSPFVAARVGEILESTDMSMWKWVPTKDNVADDGTKWLHRPNLASDSRWYRGPDFLQQNRENWPVMSLRNQSTEEELRPSLLFHQHVIDPVIQVSRFSRWKRLVNVTAYVLRFIRNLKLLRGKQPANIGSLTNIELRQAEEHNFRQAQNDVYQDELVILKRARITSTTASIPKSSSIYELSPFLDDCDVLRMKGRAGACEFISYETNNPVILPQNHPITLLIIASYHEKFHHRNHDTVVNEIRQKYCITRLRATLKKIRKQCQWCKNRDVVPHPPEMAELPAARLAAFTRPFTHVGVDYFGPIEINIGRRIEKRWGVLLTCLTVRAVHIEIAASLSTNSCIIALRNFVSRRGTPCAFYSDRGTNFVGACKELKQQLQNVDKMAIAREFTTPETEWHFNPPASPHMGGAWERLIQSVKRNLMEVLGTRRLTEEELRNALIEIENILNSRPLTHVPVDANSETALTPNHMLLGSSGGSKPLTTCDDSAAVVRRGWQLSQVMTNHFWRRWLRDYLPEITKRTKWFQKVKPISVGDTVVIADPDHPRNCWPMGRVIATSGKDGQVRSATVQTAKNIYERPAVKLAVLDILNKE